MTPKEQFEEIQANSNQFSTANIRQVQGGYIVAGQTQYNDKETGAVLAAYNAEGIAGTAETACTMALNYLRTGAFEAPSKPVK